MSNTEDLIKVFRNSNKRWIVSVAMISEGVDIKRLRVLVYLPYALTQLAFVQAIGRVVRTLGPKDTSRAYVIMPSNSGIRVHAPEGKMFLCLCKEWNLKILLYAKSIAFFTLPSRDLILFKTCLEVGVILSF